MAERYRPLEAVQVLKPQCIVALLSPQRCDVANGSFDDEFVYFFDQLPRRRCPERKIRQVRLSVGSCRPKIHRLRVATYAPHGFTPYGIAGDKPSEANASSVSRDRRLCSSSAARRS